MHHRVLEGMSALLAERGIASYRFQFPYMEAGKKRPDGRRVLLATVAAAVADAAARTRGLPIVAGGKSMGGRMSSQWMAEGGADAVRGLVFLGFPLHAAGRPGDERAAHLDAVQVPMLFLQGTRDSLAELGLIGGVVRALGTRASMHVIEGGDHSFGVLKRSGRDPEEVMGEAADSIARWIDARILHA